MYQLIPQSAHVVSPNGTIRFEGAPYGGEVSMFLGECPPDMGTGFEAWTLLENGPWFAPAVGALDSQSGILFSIAHWLLILFFLLIWAGFLAWRVRRMKRLAAAPETDR